MVSIKGDNMSKKAELFKEVTTLLYANFDNADKIVEVISPLLRPNNNNEKYAIRDEKGNLVSIRCSLSGKVLPKEEFPRSNRGIYDVDCRYGTESKWAKALKRKHIGEVKKKNVELMKLLPDADEEETAAILKEMKYNMDSEPLYE